jgi:hypothetical protein
MKLVSTLLLLVLAFAPGLSAASAPPAPAAPDATAEAFVPACSVAPAAAMSLQALAGIVSGTKCASCNDQFRACKEFCGTNNPIFSCQGSSPCAATCVCP